MKLCIENQESWSLAFTAALALFCIIVFGKFNQLPKGSEFFLMNNELQDRMILVGGRANHINTSKHETDKDLCSGNMFSNEIFQWLVLIGMNIHLAINSQLYIAQL
jgi:hypothetical protein